MPFIGGQGGLCGYLRKTRWAKRGNQQYVEKTMDRPFGGVASPTFPDQPQNVRRLVRVLHGISFFLAFSCCPVCPMCPMLPMCRMCIIFSTVLVHHFKTPALFQCDWDQFLIFRPVPQLRARFSAFFVVGRNLDFFPKQSSQQFHERWIASIPWDV